MAGLFFGTSRWDDIPQQLGMRVEGGYLTGTWRGVPVQAYFSNHLVRSSNPNVDDYYEHYTTVRADFDPPLLLGLGWPNRCRWLTAEHERRVLDSHVVAEMTSRMKAARLECNYSDEYVMGHWKEYVGAVDAYRAAFDALAWAVQTISTRRAAEPAPWEQALRANWPAVANGWTLGLDPRRAQMTGRVHGHQVTARVAVARPEGDRAKEVARLTTRVDIGIALPPHGKLSLARQDGDGFFKRLFRGQDIQVGDPEFDAAFVIKGEPEPLVRSLLGPDARRQIMTLLAGGAALSVKDGMLTAWAPGFTSTGDELDRLLKCSFAAADAFGHPGG